MSRRSHQNFLERAALQEAQKAFRSSDAINRQKLGALRIQTVEPWKRLTAIILGLTIGGLAAFLSQKGVQFWILLAVVAISLGVILIGCFGRKKTVDAVFDAAGDQFFQKVLDSVW